MYMEVLLIGENTASVVQCSWRELGVDARRDWGKWARRNYQSALLRQSQESQEYSSGDEDFFRFSYFFINMFVNLFLNIILR